MPTCSACTVRRGATRETRFETKELERAFNAAMAYCTELTRAEAAHFVEHGPRAEVVCGATNRPGHLRAGL